MIPVDHYRINIARHGHHWARIILEQEQRESAVKKFNKFREKFPESEGYTVTITSWISRGYDVEVE